MKEKISESMPEVFQFPVIDSIKCVKCKKCIEICPLNVISEKDNFSCSKCMKYCLTLEVPCTPDFYIFDYERCDNCGLCIEQCPEKAIGWYKIQQ